jgi:ribosomal protein L28
VRTDVEKLGVRMEETQDRWKSNCWRGQNLTVVPDGHGSRVRVSSKTIRKSPTIIINISYRTLTHIPMIN